MELLGSAGLTTKFWCSSREDCWECLFQLAITGICVEVCRACLGGACYLVARMPKVLETRSAERSWLLDTQHWVSLAVEVVSHARPAMLGVYGHCCDSILAMGVMLGSMAKQCCMCSVSKQSNTMTWREIQPVVARQLAERESFFSGNQLLFCVYWPGIVSCCCSWQALLHSGKRGIVCAVSTCIVT